MSEGIKKRAQPSDQQAFNEAVGCIKAFLSGAMATSGRQIDLDRNVLYAAAEANRPQPAVLMAKK